VAVVGRDAASSWEEYAVNVTPRLQRDDFDSILHIPSAFSVVNCLLTIHLRVFLDPFNGTEFTRRGRTYRTRRWRNDEWNEFVFRYKHISNHYWNNRFWLTPPATFSGLDLPLHSPTGRPNVFCKLNLEVVTSQANSHVRIRVVRVADDEPQFFRSHSRLYDHEDVQVRRSGDYLQIPVVHEVGHLLGIDHPGKAAGVPACRRNGNLQSCYGRNGYERDQISGSGMAFRAEHAKPWRNRIAEHTRTNANGWGVSLSRVQPRLLNRVGARP
jgi:hypothetical protein